MVVLAQLIAGDGVDVFCDRVNLIADVVDVAFAKVVGLCGDQLAPPRALEGYLEPVARVGKGRCGSRRRDCPSEEIQNIASSPDPVSTISPR